MKHRRHWPWLLALLLVACSGILYAIFRPRERLLLDRATQVIARSNGDWAYWLSNDSLLRVRYSDSPDGNYIFSEYNVPLGKDTPLPALQRIFRDTAKYRSIDIVVSPDSERLLWYGDDGIWQSTLDGASQMYHESDMAMNVCWLFDSRRWIEFGYEDLSIWARLHDISSPHQSALLHITPPTPVPAGDVRMTLDNHLLTAQWESNVRPLVVTIIESRIAPDIRALKTSVVRFAPGQEIVHVTLSPYSDRVAWVLSKAEGRPFETWIHRLFPRYEVPSRTIFGLWVSRRDGSDMREVGHLPQCRKT